MKKALLAGVSAAALVLSASAAFAAGDNNNANVNSANNVQNNTNNTGFLITDVSNAGNTKLVSDTTETDNNNSGQIAAGDNSNNSGNTTNANDNGSRNSTTISDNGSRNTTIISSDTSVDNSDSGNLKSVSTTTNNDGSVNASNSGTIAGRDSNSNSGNVTQENGNGSGNIARLNNNLSNNVEEETEISLTNDTTTTSTVAGNQLGFDGTEAISGNMLATEVTGTNVQFNPEAVDVLGVLYGDSGNDGSGINMGTFAGSNTQNSNTTNSVNVSVDRVNM